MSANAYLPPSPVIPMSLLISNITQSNPMVITVEESNTYVPKMLVHLVVPYDYGMTQANDLTVEIESIDGLNFYVDVDSTLFDPFVTPESIYLPQPASLSPAGSRNLQYNNFTRQVPFQSLGNFGN
jgi:hypothetical protein